MSKAQHSNSPRTCPVEMSDSEPCGRLIHSSPTGADEEPVCLMHSRDPKKDKVKFRQEIDAILDGTSDHQSRDKYDFTHFVFPDRANFTNVGFALDADFSDATFTQLADFGRATFTQLADFGSATFTDAADFRWATFTHAADFRWATFTQTADFSRATFTQTADFSRATFTHAADFTWATFTRAAGFDWATFTQTAHFRFATFTRAAEFGWATFSQVADFSGARFEQPARVLFEQVNRESDAGLRARYINSCIEEVSFTDVHWHLLQGRMVLQDELDIITGERNEHGLVAVAYRQLVNNFEKVRNYELAEDCFIGAMEMRRLAPRNFLLGRREPFRRLYEKYLWARKVGGWISVVNAYRLLSIYGSSYTRALAVLFGLLLLCALLFPAFGLRMTENSRPQGVQTSTVAFCPQEASISWCRAWVNDERARELWRTFKAGAWAALEVATFQRRPTVEPTTTWGRRLAIPEMVAIPAQLALFFLALRRRFKR
jgi:hypothetical protein